MAKVSFNATAEHELVMYVDKLVEEPTNEYRNRGDVVQAAIKALKKERGD
ncbi:MAG: hypothetical protein QHH15_00365 [Candidatus Thermoplasmatota archaeon]|nr:hypothetical protein [Candidatus Thermoplasmatota archaeon]